MSDKEKELQRDKAWAYIAGCECRRDELKSKYDRGHVQHEIESVVAGFVALEIITKEEARSAGYWNDRA